MAQVPYSAAGQTVTPDITPPDDYQHINASPDAFGSNIGQGVKALGQGAVQASAFYGQVAADDGTNQFVGRVNKLLYGDPTKMVPQPDGTMAPDTGYLGLKGADKMRAYPTMQDAIDSARKEVRESLSTPESQLEFDNYSRRYAQLKQSEIGADYERAHNEYAQNTNKSAAEIAVGDVARGADDDAKFEGARENLRTAYVKAAHVAGFGPEGVTLAVQNADRDAWKARIEAISVSNPARAKEMTEAHRNELGTDYERVAKEVRSRASLQIGTQYGTSLVSAATAGRHGQSFFLGDSVADGLKGTAGAPGDTHQGRTPTDVLKAISAADPRDLAGRTVYLSSGLSNAHGDSDLGTVGQQIDTLRAKGVPAASIKVVGVGDRADFRGLNDKLQAIAKDKGVVFTGALDSSNLRRNPNDPSDNGVHASDWRKEWARVGGGAPPASAPAASGGVGGFGAALARTFHEEGGYNAADANGAPVNFGINQKAHPEVDVSKLTRAQAAGIYKRDYWDAIGGDQLAASNPSLAHVAFDTAVVEGAGRAKGWLAQAGGDPQKFLALREQYETGLVAHDPATYAKYARTWASRRANLAQDIGLPGGAPRSAPASVEGVPMSSPESAAADAAAGFPTSVVAPAAPAAPGAPPAAPAGEGDKAAMPPAPPDYAALKAGLYDQIERSDMDWETKQHARAAVSQELATQEMIAGVTAREKKEQNDKAANGYVTQLLGGTSGPGVIGKIANDPMLTWETKERLYDIAAKHSGSDIEEAANSYGPGYWDAYKRVTLPAGAPGKLSDPDEILRMAGPGGNMTLRGASALIGTISTMRKDADQASIQQAKAGQMNYARSKLTFDQEMLYPGIRPMKDEKGVQLFEAQFIPKFNAAFDAHVKAGGDPWKFLTQENTDKLITGMRDPRKMAADKVREGSAIDAEAGVTGKAVEPSYAVPEGMKPEHWNLMVTNPPTHADGSRVNSKAWVMTLDKFGTNPTEEMAKAFDEDQARRAAAGQPTLSISGKEILAGLRGEIKPLGSAEKLPPKVSHPVVKGQIHPPRAPAPPMPTGSGLPSVEIGKFNPGALVSPALQRDISTVKEKVFGK